MTHHVHRNGAEGEEIHLPQPSLLPLFTAAGLTLALLGLILSWWFVGAGGLIVFVAVVRWIRAAREEIESLPSEHH